MPMTLGGGGGGRHHPPDGRGHGAGLLGGRGRGDLLVAAVVDTPTDLDTEVEEALRRIAELRGEDVAPAERGFLSRIKSAFT